jgi:type II secretory pathway predicted ATPase ExeA
MDSENRLCLLFVGHPEIRRRLALAAHEALDQRIVVRAHVPGLSRDELEPYLRHLLRRAGTELQLFEPAALEAIFQATGGMPRKINQLAHYALFAAAVAKTKTASAEHITSALAEIS